MVMWGFLDVSKIALYGGDRIPFLIRLSLAIIMIFVMASTGLLVSEILMVILRGEGHAHLGVEGVPTIQGARTDSVQGFPLSHELHREVMDEV